MHQALKGYALEKLGLPEEAEETADQAAALKPTDEGTLQPLVMVYRALGKRNYLCLSIDFIADMILVFGRGIAYQFLSRTESTEGMQSQTRTNNYCNRPTHYYPI